jgi:hypothetical protein
MDIDNIGLALMVGGAAIVCWGLVFMMPSRSSRQAEQEETDKADHQPPTADYQE